MLLLIGLTSFYAPCVFVYIALQFANAGTGDFKFELQCIPTSLAVTEGILVM